MLLVNLDGTSYLRPTREKGENHWSPTHRLNELIAAFPEDPTENAFQLDEEILYDNYLPPNHLARCFDVKQTREAVNNYCCYCIMEVL